jgi:hypothetical protein
VFALFGVQSVSKRLKDVKRDCHFSVARYFVRIFL